MKNYIELATSRNGDMGRIQLETMLKCVKARIDQMIGGKK